MRAILIISRDRSVHEINLEDAIEHGRFIKEALVPIWTFPTGDTLYVDDQGLLKNPQFFFWLKNTPDGHMLAGNGILIGPEEISEDGIETNLDVKMTCEELTLNIEFMRASAFVT